MPESAKPSLWEFRFRIRRNWREPWETITVIAPSSAEAVAQLPDSLVAWEFATLFDGSYRGAA